MREYRADAARASWLQIVDTDAGNKVVGAALWNTYRENPYPVYEAHPVEAYWWPEGEFFALRVVVVVGVRELGTVDYVQWWVLLT